MEKFLPPDMAEGIERFIIHLCKSEADRDSNTREPTSYRSKYEIEIKRNVAHIWELQHGRSSVAWVVLADGGIVRAKPDPEIAGAVFHFKRGDILKSATWKAPAKNFARGNVLTDTAFPRWH